MYLFEAQAPLNNLFQYTLLDLKNLKLISFIGFCETRNNLISTSQTELRQEASDLFTVVTNPTNRKERKSYCVVVIGGCTLNLKDLDIKKSESLSERVATKITTLWSSSVQAKHDVFVFLTAPTEELYANSHSVVLKIELNLDRSIGFNYIKAKCSFYKINSEAVDQSYSYQLLNKVLNFSSFKEVDAPLTEATADDEFECLSDSCACGRSCLDECYFSRNIFSLNYSDVFPDGESNEDPTDPLVVEVSDLLHGKMLYIDGKYYSLQKAIFDTKQLESQMCTLTRGCPMCGAIQEKDLKRNSDSSDHCVPTTTATTASTAEVLPVPVAIAIPVDKNHDATTAGAGLLSEVYYDGAEISVHCRVSVHEELIVVADNDVVPELEEDEAVPELEEDAVPELEEDTAVVNTADPVDDNHDAICLLSEAATGLLSEVVYYDGAEISVHRRYNLRELVPIETSRFIRFRNPDLDHDLVPTKENKTVDDEEEVKIRRPLSRRSKRHQAINFFNQIIVAESSNVI